MTEHIERGLNLTESLERIDPFKNLIIADNDFLNQIKERSPCSKCRKSRKFFCYTCYIPVDKLDGLLPNVEV